MRQPQRSRLLRLLDTQSQSGNTRRMRGVMKEMLEDAGMEVRTINQQLFARKGSAEHVPFIVAHADTVHRIVPRDRYRVAYEVKDGEVIHHAFDPKTNRSRGIGGDDKCGLWMAQEMARNLESCAVVITVDEEIGCVGARRVTREQLADATVLIQGDRRGKDDAITRASGVNIASLEWQDHVRQNVRDHGYNYYTFGAGTDVAAMHDTNAAQVSAINLAVGYHLPHSDGEYIRESELENGYELAMRLAMRSADRRWEHNAVRHVYKSQRQGEDFVTPFFSEWFASSTYAKQKGYHATGLIRDVHINRPSPPKWVYNRELRRTESADGRYVCLFVFGGVIIYSKDDLDNVYARIIEVDPRQGEAYNAYSGPPSRALVVTRYLTSHMEKGIRSESGPLCGLVDGCNEPAQVFHTYALRWGCDVHIAQVMKDRGEQYLSERPKLLTTVQEILELDRWPLDNDDFAGYHYG
jgi:putative aminopeptidase FrvX